MPVYDDKKLQKNNKNKQFLEMKKRNEKKKCVKCDTTGGELNNREILVQG